MTDTLADLVDGWPVPAAAVAVVDGDGLRWRHGDTELRMRIASVSKLLTTYAVLVAVEEETVALDDPAGRPGATLRHLLAHAAGYPFDSRDPVAEVGRRRIYSNAGIEIAAELVSSRAGMPFVTYLRQAVFEPLGMHRTELVGSPAHGVHSDVDDLSRFVVELLAPRLIAPTTLAEATRSQFPDLAGIVPGVGRFDPNPWGLGFELRGDKWPHWTGRRCTAATFGHFGGSGSFLWVDPRRGLAAVALTGREFDRWAMEVWPVFSDAAVDRFSAPDGS